MSRLTNPSKEFECRWGQQCEAEQWFYDIYGEYPESLCDNCPFMKFINALAEKEDAEDEKIRSCIH